MTPVFSFIAYSNTGKTTYLASLIAALTRRGLRVGALKHDAHEFEIDKPGKDSWRFGQAGAAVVAVTSATKCAVMDYRSVSFAETLSRIKDVDIIIAEGWHTEAENAIALYRSGSGKPLKLAPEDCVAVVSDVPMETGDTPLFPLDDAEPMADFLCARLSESKN